MNSFYYIDNEHFIYNDKTLIKIYVLDFKNKFVHIIYKSFSKDLASKLDNLKAFDNITNSISFVIKRNGKISLDIK